MFTKNSPTFCSFITKVFFSLIYYERSICVVTASWFGFLYAIPMNQPVCDFEQ